jgi:hypothetical protein
VRGCSITGVNGGRSSIYEVMASTHIQHMRTSLYARPLKRSFGLEGLSSGTRHSALFSVGNRAYTKWSACAWRRSSVAKETDAAREREQTGRSSAAEQVCPSQGVQFDHIAVCMQHQMLSLISRIPRLPARYLRRHLTVAQRGASVSDVVKICDSDTVHEVKP